MPLTQLIQTALLAVAINPPSALTTTKSADCLARNIWFEARNSNFTDKLAVAHVVLNRVDATAFPNSICDVIYEHAQFSWTIDGKSDDIIIKDALSRSAWKETLLATRLAIEAHTPDITKGATHYHAHYVTPYWSSTMLISAKFGAHIYYTDIQPTAGPD